MIAPGRRRGSNAVGWVVCCGVLVSSIGWAAPVRVVVTEPSGAEPVVAEIATRVRAELAAHGFEVVALSLASGSDPRAEVEAARIEPSPIATLSIVRFGKEPAIDVWVHDRLTGKTLVKRLKLEKHRGTNVTTALAIHAVELLRASLLETRTRSETKGRTQKSAPVPDEVSDWVEEVVAPRASPFDGPSVAVGGAAIQSLGGLGAAIGPALRVAVGVPSGFAGRLSIAGPLFGAELEAQQGTAFVRQELALLEVVYAPAYDWFSPVASLGAGAYHLYASGQPSDPKDQAASGEVWAALFDVGLGVAGRLGAGAFVFADLHAVLSEPAAEVGIGEERLGPAGRPSFMATLGLQSSL